MVPYYLSTIRGRHFILILIVMAFTISSAWLTSGDGQPKTPMGQSGHRITNVNTVDAELLQQIQSTPLHMTTPTMFFSGPKTYDLFVSLPQQPQALDIITITSDLIYNDLSVLFLPMISDPCQITSYIDSSDELSVQSTSFNPPIQPISIPPSTSLSSLTPPSLDILLSQETIDQLFRSSPLADTVMNEMSSRATSFISPLQHRFFYHIGLRCSLVLESAIAGGEVPGEPGLTFYHSTLRPSPKRFHISISSKQSSQAIVDEDVYITPTEIVLPSIQVSLQSATFDDASQQYVYRMSVKSSHICTVMVLFPVAPTDTPKAGGDPSFEPFGKQITSGGEMIKTITTRSRSNDLFRLTYDFNIDPNHAFIYYRALSKYDLLYRPQLDLSQFSASSDLSVLTILKTDAPLTYAFTSPSRLIAPKGLVLQTNLQHARVNIDNYYTVIDATQWFHDQHHQQQLSPTSSSMGILPLHGLPTVMPSLHAPLLVPSQFTTRLNIHFKRLGTHGLPIHRFSLDLHRLYHTMNLYCELSLHHLVHQPEIPLEFSILNFQPDGNMVDAAHAAMVAGCLVSPQPQNMDAGGDDGDGSGNDTHRITTTLFKFYSRDCYEYFYHTQLLVPPGNGWGVQFDIELRNERHGTFIPIVPSLVCIQHDQWPNQHPHNDDGDNINNHPQLHFPTKLSDLAWDENPSINPQTGFSGTLPTHHLLHSYQPHFLYAHDYLKHQDFRLTHSIRQRPGRPQNHLAAMEFLFLFHPLEFDYLAENGSLEFHIALPIARLQIHTCTCGVSFSPISSLDDPELYDESQGRYTFSDSQACHLTPMTLQSGEQYSTIYHHRPEFQFKLEVIRDYLLQGDHPHLMVVCPIDQSQNAFVIPSDTVNVYLASAIYYQLTSSIENPALFQVPITGMYITVGTGGSYSITPAQTLPGHIRIMTLSFSHYIGYDRDFSDALISCTTSLINQFGDSDIPPPIPIIVHYSEYISMPFYINPSETSMRVESYATTSSFSFEESMSTQSTYTPSMTVWIALLNDDFTKSYSVEELLPDFKQLKQFIPHLLQSCLTSTLQPQQPSPSPSMQSVNAAQQAHDDIDKSPLYQTFLRSLIGNANHLGALRSGSLQPRQVPLTVLESVFTSMPGNAISTSCFGQTGCNAACRLYCVIPREYRRPVQQEMHAQEQQHFGTALGGRPSFHIDVDPDDYDALLRPFQLQTCQVSSECSPYSYCGADGKCYAYPHINNQFVPFLQPETYDNILHCVQRTPVANADGEYTYTYQRTSCGLNASEQCPNCQADTEGPCNVEVIMACYNQSFDMYVPQEYCVMPDTLPGLTEQTAARLTSITSLASQSTAHGVITPISTHINTNIHAITNTPGESLGDTETILGATFLRYADHYSVFSAIVDDIPSCNCIHFPYNTGEQCEIPVRIANIHVTRSTGKVINIGDAATHHYLAKDDTVDITWTFTGRGDAPVQVYLMSTRTTSTATTLPQQQYALRYVGSTRGDKQSYTIVVPHLQRDVYTKGMTVVLFVGELSAVVDPVGVTLPTAPTSFIYGADQPIKLFYQPQCFAWNDTTQTNQSVCPGTAECSLTLDRCVGCPAGFLGPLCDQFICETTDNRYAMSPQCVPGHYKTCTVNGVVFTRPVETVVTATAAIPLFSQPTPFSPSSSSDTMAAAPTQVAPNGGSTCECTPDWSGAQCASAVVCAGRSFSTSLVCLNNGYRHYDPESDECDAQCTCTHHWSGARCNTCGLTCTSTQRGYPTMDCRACQCTYGYTGAQCECRFLRGDITFSSYPEKYHRVFTGEAYAAVSAYEKQYVYGNAAANGEQPPPAAKAEYLATLELIAGYNILMDSIHRELTSSIDIPEARQHVTIASVILSPPRQNGNGNGNRSLTIVVQIMDSCGKGSGGDDINSMKLAWDNLARLLRDGERPPIIIHDPDTDTAIDIGDITDVTDLVDPVAETNGDPHGDLHSHSNVVLLSAAMYAVYTVISMAIAILLP